MVTEIDSLKIDCGEYKNNGALWVDREGNVYSVYGSRAENQSICGHSDFAQAMGFDGPDDLEDRGWIHVSGFSFMAYHSRLTRKQKEFIKDWAIFNGLEEDTIKKYEFADPYHVQWMSDERIARVKEWLNLDLSPIKAQCPEH